MAVSPSRSEVPLTVVHICPGSVSDRPSMTFVRRQVQDLRALGIEVHEAYIEDRQSLGGIRRAVAEVRRALKSHKPQILHAHYGTVTALVGVLSGFRPLVITFRGSDLNPDGTSSRLKMLTKILMSQLGALFAERIITVSDQLKERLWWNKSVATVIADGVDVDRFFPMDRDVAREQLNWDRDEKVIFFNAARNPHNKRLDLAEEVARLVKETYPNTRLHVLAGATDPEDVPRIMNASDVLLMLSDFEGSPNVVKEALACNLPVVAFDVGDVAARLHGVSGCYVVPRDTRAVVDAVCKCLSTGLRSDGRAHIDPVSSRTSAHQVQNVYAEIVSANRA